MGQENIDFDIDLRFFNSTKYIPDVAVKQCEINLVWYGFIINKSDNVKNFVSIFTASEWINWTTPYTASVMPCVFTASIIDTQAMNG